MAFFAWKDNFDIGISDIDHQHRGFLEMLNDCYDEALGHPHAPISPEMISRLKEYAATHFRNEEALMKYKGFPDIERHSRRHRYFESLLMDLESGRMHGETADLNGMLAFLRDWFLNHILEEDRKIAAYL